MKVKIFSTRTCPYCQMLKNYLLDLKIEFTESFVDDEAGAKEEMMKISDGYLGVPFTWIEKDDGNISKIIGFNRRELDAIFKKTS